MALGGRTDREMYNNFIVSVRDNLKGRGIIDRVEYTGSRYKGTSIDSSDYDNVFIKRDTTITTRPSPYANYFYLETRYGEKIKRTDRLAMFKAELQKTLCQIGAASFAQIIKAYEPTAVVRYSRPELTFLVDMVYGLDVGDQIFVAKAPVRAGPCDSNLWYKTSVLKEKNLMRTIDFNNGIGKMVIRRLKKLQEVEPTLQMLSSYVFEQALFYLKDEHPDALFWRENNMMEILKMTFLFLREALERGELPSYLDRTNNTIGRLSSDERIHLANRFRNLAARPEIVLHKTS